MKQIWIIPILALLVASPVMAIDEQAGSLSAVWLQNMEQLIPERQALGGTGTAAIEGDVAGLFYNPAGIASDSGLRPQVSLTHMLGIMGQNHDQISGILGIPKIGVFGLALYYSGFDLSMNDDQGVPVGKAQIYDLSATLGYARSQSFGSWQMAYGAAFKYIRESLGIYGANTVAFDGGVIALVPDFELAINGVGAHVRNLRIGFALQNLGLGLKFVSARDPLPLSGRLGLYYPILWGLVNQGLSTSVDYMITRNTPDSFRFGVQYANMMLKSFQFFGRIGWHSDYEGLNWTSGFAVGAGVRTQILSGYNIGIDYALQPMYPVGFLNVVSATLRF